MVLVRFLLVSLILYLIIRLFVKDGKEGESVTGNKTPENKSKINTKSVSKEVGEYIDYEEIKK